MFTFANLASETEEKMDNNITTNDKKNVEENKNRANDPSYKNIIKDMSSFLHKKKRTLNK